MDKKTENENIDTSSIIYLGAGCFWGVEETLRKLDGVIETEVGYMGGKTQDPTYGDVCSGKTGHTEVVKVRFNPKKLVLEDLLKKFWEIHTPVYNPKENSPKTQYKSVIFFTKESQKHTAKKIKDQISDKIEEKIPTEILKAPTFYKAEKRHQKYYKKMQNK